MQINNIKCHKHNRKLKLTFNWPPSILEVQVNEKLFTLQEYKKNGGYITEKTPGYTTYTIAPIKNGKILCEYSDNITHLEKTIITYEINESRFGRYTNHLVTLTANYPVPPKILQYSRSAVNNLVDNNATALYYLYEEISTVQPLTRVIRTPKYEKLHFFINNEMRDIYGIVQKEERGNRAGKTRRNP